MPFLQNCQKWTRYSTVLRT